MSIAKVVSALSKAQKEFKQPEKNGKAAYRTKSGHMVNYSYADIASIIRATRPGLTANGLSITQFMDEQTSHLDVITAKGDVSKTETVRDFRSYLVTRLYHESGEYLESKQVLELSTQNPQEAGSKLTYFKRYHLQSLIGVAGEEDADGKSQPECLGVTNSDGKPKENKETANYQKMIQARIDALNSLVLKKKK